MFFGGLFHGFIASVSVLLLSSAFVIGIIAGLVVLRVIFDHLAGLVGLLIQLVDVLVHLPDGQVQHFPSEQFGELGHGLLREDPIGHRGALHDLSLKQLVHQDHHHLLVRRPQLAQRPQHADLGLFGVADGLQGRVELGDGRERVREALAAQIEQRVDEHPDAERMALLILFFVGDFFEDAQHLFVAHFGLDGRFQLG